jgi:L-iditol 2-dehydrogenase
LLHSLQRRIMKALVKYAKGNGNMEIREIPEPTPGPGQVKIEVKAAGICGSDLHIYHDDIAIPVNPPVVTGHEFSGVVVEVGEGVTACKVGDRVVAETAYSFCGKCVYCITGFYNLCNERKTLGYWYNGVFAKYTVVPQEKIHALPDSIDFISAALIEPLACITHAVLELTTIIVGDVVLVVGPGAIGLATLQVAKAQGATVIVSGTSIDNERLKMAKTLGADYTINVMEEDLQEFINKITNGKGVDVVLECSGAGRAADDAIKVIKKQGSFTQIGLFGKPITIDLEKMCYKELKLTGSLGSRWTSWVKAIQLIEQGKVKTKPLVSHQMPITDWEKAFKIFENKEGLKLVLTPVED